MWGEPGLRTDTQVLLGKNQSFEISSRNRVTHHYQLDYSSDVPAREITLGSTSASSKNFLLTVSE